MIQISDIFDDLKRFCKLHMPAVCFVFFDWPMQVRPSTCSRDPALHWQWYELRVFTHLCWQPPLWTWHSSISARQHTRITLKSDISTTSDLTANVSSRPGKKSLTSWVNIQSLLYKQYSLSLFVFNACNEYYVQKKTQAFKKLDHASLKCFRFKPFWDLKRHCPLRSKLTESKIVIDLRSAGNWRPSCSLSHVCGLPTKILKNIRLQKWKSASHRKMLFKIKVK